jgi:hypothetical protein
MMADNIYTALAKAQTSMGKALKDSSNPHFKSKYADLASVMNACLGALTANGIAVTHSTEWSETEQQLVTTFTHGASDTACSIAIPLLLGKRDMQGLGSALTYARRYGVMALAGIAPEDDDGNAAVAAAPSKATQALSDAWTDAVLDSLPESATPRQKAEAFAQAICDEFQGKGEKALGNVWEKRKKLVAKFESEYPDLHEKVVDAMLTREAELLDAKRETVPV